jgi:hypothetical protein
MPMPPWGDRRARGEALRTSTGVLVSSFPISPRLANAWGRAGKPLVSKITLRVGLVTLPSRLPNAAIGCWIKARA